MKTQISNKALNSALAVRDLNVVLFKDEIGHFTFNIKTGSGIDEHVFHIKGDGKKFSDHTPAKWADMIADVIATDAPKIEDVVETMEKVTGIQNDPELQAEINDKLQDAFEESTLTPIQKQFNDLKAKHPDAILLFRCGDFYETYHEDAKVISEILGITLTKSSKTDTYMAGFPYSALDTYLPKIIRAGKRVAICDQLEDPKKTKKLVKRGITDLVSPAPKAETTPEVAPEAPVSTPTEPEKPAQKAKEKVEKTLDERKAEILDKLGKQVQNMYRKFNVNAVLNEHESSYFATIFLHHVDDTLKECSLSLHVFNDGKIKVYTSVPEVFTLESTSIQMDFYLRLNYLLQDANRQAKLREYVKKAITDVENLNKEIKA